jgi:hypothetical protein
VRRLFFRCQNGHFITDGCCPIDAWTHEQVNRVASMFCEDPSLSVEDIARSGIDMELARRILIIESLVPMAVEFATLSVIKPSG